MLTEQECIHLMSLLVSADKSNNDLFYMYPLEMRNQLREFFESTTDHLTYGETSIIPVRFSRIEKYQVQFDVKWQGLNILIVRITATLNAAFSNYVSVEIYSNINRAPIRFREQTKEEIEDGNVRSCQLWSLFYQRHFSDVSFNRPDIIALAINKGIMASFEKITQL